MTITFEKLPGNLEELKAMPQASLDQPEYGAALFVAVMMHYMVNKEETFEMLDFLNGPYEVTPFQKQFLADRMADGDYVVRSFFNGTSPDNDYTPSMPYTIETEKGFDQEIDGRMRIFLKSSGADSKRYITMRHKPSTNQWFVEEQLILSMIRKPKSQDEWA
ncbi:DUF6935 domain-containing protein [Butyrivibrio sp. AE2032]|uniref:DUF6935 domain-containing protein n=1 Tax=Butyrivibrio sp. AE2032 TaxID=1458463 RepID=UPI0005504DCD|nr:hypothetical protein [Butyrivibrio sp. AE2032]